MSPSRVKVAPWPGGLYGGAGIAGGGGASPPAWLLAGASGGLNFKEDSSWNGSIEGVVSDYLSASRGSGKWMWHDAAPHLRWIETDVLPLSDRGLCVEDQITNNILYSDDLSQTSYWNVSSGTLTGGQSDPTGGTAACRYNEGVASAVHEISSQAGASNHVPVTVSLRMTTYVIVKYVAGPGFMQLTYPLAQFSLGGYRNYDLQNGTLGSTGGTIATSEIIALGSGWYLCIFSADCTNAGNATIPIISVPLSTSTRRPTFVGTSAQFDIYSVDVVLGTSGWSSHISTAASTATRMADVITLGGDLETIAIASKAHFVQTMLARQNGRFVNFNNSRRVEGVSSTTNRAHNGTNTATATIGSGSITTGRVKHAFGHDASGMSAVGNGGVVVTSAQPWGTPTAPVTIGSDLTGTTSIRGWLEQIQWSNTKNQFNGDTTP